MDTLIVVIIVGLASAFTTEFVGNLNVTPLDTRTIKSWLTIPTVFLYHWCLGTMGNMYWVGSLASAFISLAVVIFVSSKDTNVVTEVRRSRRG